MLETCVARLSLMGVFQNPFYFFLTKPLQHKQLNKTNNTNNNMDKLNRSKTCSKCKGKKFIEGYAFGEKISLTCNKCYGLGKTPQ